MKRLLLSCLLLVGCAGGPPESQSQQALRVARALGGAAVNVYVVPRLVSDHPQLMAALDMDQDGVLSLAEVENVAKLDEASIATMLVLLIDALARR
jgi:hypothetical protein